MDLAKEIFRLTGLFPPSELYGITAQMRRAVVSIPSNIAEGRRRSTRKDFCHFLLNAFGSGAELETQVIISKALPFGKRLDFAKTNTLLDEVMRMLNTMIQKLQATS